MNETTAAVDASTTTPDAGDTTTPDVSIASPAPATADAPATEAKTPEVVVPEAYEFAMPEGVELDKAAADEFSVIAKELKLDQATAQKVADVGAKMVQRQVEAHAKQVEQWTESVKADKEFGGDKLTENLGIARKALDTFGTPELKDILNATGLGNNPEIIRAFYRAGKAISEDGFVKGIAVGVNTDPAKRMFPTMN